MNPTGATAERDRRVAERIFAELEQGGPDGRLPEPDQVLAFVAGNALRLPVALAARLIAVAEAALGGEILDRRAWQALWDAARAGSAAAARSEPGDVARQERLLALDEALAAAIAPFGEQVVRRWLSLTAHGLEHVPAAGAALLVCRPRGLVPLDAALLELAVLRHAPARRHLRVIGRGPLVGVPLAGIVLGLAGLQGLGTSAAALLAAGEAVAAFCDGTTLPVVEAGLAARLPIVPVRIEGRPLPGSRWTVEMLEPLSAPDGRGPIDGAAARRLGRRLERLIR